jgi:hypothetical protein
MCITWASARRSPQTRKHTARPLDVPTRERPAAICSRIRLFDIRLFFDCSSVVLQFERSADRRPASLAGSVVARHPAGGSTRRRSMVFVSGGPFRAELKVGAWLQRRPCHAS